MNYQDGKQKCSKCGLMSPWLDDIGGEYRTELVCSDCLKAERRKASKPYKILLFLAPAIAIIIATLVYFIVYYHRK